MQGTHISTIATGLMPLHSIRQSVQTATYLVNEGTPKIIQIPWGTTAMQMTYGFFPFWNFTTYDQ
jgi:hypothetical protein